MCPACIASAVVTVAAAGSAGGILAVFTGKLRRFFRMISRVSYRKPKEE
jgi:hypothetical protein